MLTRSPLRPLRPSFAGKRLCYGVETTVSHSWLCGTSSSLQSLLVALLSRVRSVFVVLFVRPHGVTSEPGAPEDIRLGGDCGFFIPGVGPAAPAAVPGLMGFIERARAKEEEKSIV